MHVRLQAHRAGGFSIRLTVRKATKRPVLKCRCRRLCIMMAACWQPAHLPWLVRLHNERIAWRPALLQRMCDHHKAVCRYMDSEGVMHQQRWFTSVTGPMFHLCCILLQSSTQAEYKQQ